MTGVAAQWCGAAPPAYRRKPSNSAGRRRRGPPPAWGARRVVLGDLSPAATFIAANYNIPFDVEAFHAAASRLLEEVDAEIGWMYETRHTDGRTTGHIDYTVWSEVFSCPNCAREVVFLDEALDPATRRTRTGFPCPHCAAKLTKGQPRTVVRDAGGPRVRQAVEADPPSAGADPLQRGRCTPRKGAGRIADLEILDRVAGLPLPPEVPTNAFPIDEMYHGSRLAPKGFTHVHHLFLPRAAQALAALWRARRRVRGRIGCGTGSPSSSSKPSGACPYSRSLRHRHTISQVNRQYLYRRVLRRFPNRQTCRLDTSSTGKLPPPS